MKFAQQLLPGAKALTNKDEPNVQALLDGATCPKIEDLQKLIDTLTCRKVTSEFAKLKSQVEQFMPNGQVPNQADDLSSAMSMLKKIQEACRKLDIDFVFRIPTSNGSYIDENGEFQVDTKIAEAHKQFFFDTGATHSGWDNAAKDADGHQLTKELRQTMRAKILEVMAAASQFFDNLVEGDDTYLTLRRANATCFPAQYLLLVKKVGTKEATLTKLLQSLKDESTLTLPKDRLNGTLNEIKMVERYLSIVTKITQAIQLIRCLAAKRDETKILAVERFFLANKTLPPKWGGHFTEALREKMKEPTFSLSCFVEEVDTIQEKLSIDEKTDDDEVADRLIASFGGRPPTDSKGFLGSQADMDSEHPSNISKVRNSMTRPKGFAWCEKTNKWRPAKECHCIHGVSCYRVNCPFIHPEGRTMPEKGPWTKDASKGKRKGSTGKPEKRKGKGGKQPRIAAVTADAPADQLAEMMKQQAEFLKSVTTMMAASKSPPDAASADH